MRLIDADEMAANESEAYMNVQTSGGISPITQGLNSVVHRKIQQLIADTPTVDAVVHGRWYWDDDGYCRCAKCHQKAPVIRQWDDEPFTTMTNYCPHCGAKMDGDEP